MKWVWVWLVGPLLAFLVLALAVHAGQHGSNRWPYLVPLVIAGVVSSLLSAALAMNVVRHHKQGDVA